MRYLHIRCFMLLILTIVMPGAMSNSGFANQPANVDENWIVIEAAEGRGRTVRDARKAAMISALREIAGEYLEQRTVIENGRITDDSLLTFTTQKEFQSSDVEGYPTIEEDGSFKAIMRVQVLRGEFVRLMDRLAPASISGPVTVEVEGIGETASEAERDAVANGVKQIVGEYIQSEIKIENQKVVTDLISSYASSSNVVSERVGNYRMEGEGVLVTMRVTAELEPLVSMFQERSANATVIDGAVLAAELDLARDNIVAQRQILENLLRELPTRLLVARLIGRDGKPIENGRPSSDDMKPIVGSDEISLAINIESYFDLDTYYERVAPAIAKVLDVMALDRKPVAVACPPRSSIGSKVLFNNQRLRPKYDSRPWTNDSDTTPDKCQVILSRGRSLDGREHDADLYVLREDLFSAFGNVVNWGPDLAWKQRHLFLVVFVELLDDEGEVITSMEWNPNYLFNSSKSRTVGRDLPIFADFNGLNPYYCFNMFWERNKVKSLMINPCFSGNGVSDTSVWRHEIRLPESEFERLDRIELSAQLFEKVGDSSHPASRKVSKSDTQRGFVVEPVNPELDPVRMGWKDAQGNPIEPGGAYRRASPSGR